MRSIRICSGILLVVFMITTLASCAYGHEEGKEEKHPDIQNKVLTELGYDATYLDIVPEAGDIHNFFISKPISADVSALIRDYVASGRSTEAFKDLYYQADTIEILPLVGPCFENTSLIACAFYVQGEFNQAILMRVNVITEDADVIECSEIKRFNKQYKHYFNNEYCTSRIEICLEDCPNVELVAIMVSRFGMMFPIGINDGEEYLKHYGCGMIEFYNLEPVKSIQEAQAASQKRLQEMEQSLE